MMKNKFIANQIKEHVTMPDVLRMYGFYSRSGYRRIPCPLHNGSDKNFSFKSDIYKCFVCGKSGDVISFVQELFGLSFHDATRKLDSDFRIGLFKEKTFNELRQAHYRQLAIAARHDREQEERARSEREYWDALSEWVRLEKNLREYKPRTTDEELHPLFVEALQNIEYQEYLVDSLNDRRQ